MRHTTPRAPEANGRLLGGDRGAHHGEIHS